MQTPTAAEPPLDSGANAPLGSDYDISGAREKDRVQRFYLQSVARELLSLMPDAPKTLNAKGKPSRKGGVSKRTCGCLRRRVSKTEGVRVLHALGTKSAHYGNLQVCGSVWLCAVCGGKISERRRLEMTTAVESSGLFKVLVTYTVRHNLSDTCAELRAALVDARARLKGHSRWKALAAALGLAGHIYNFETLHNLINGWHLHFHEILLFEREPTADELQVLESEAKSLWGWALAQNGRDASWEHGVDVRVGDSYVMEYLAKFGRLPEMTGWTIEHELTKSAVKKSSLHGRTTYELLNLYGQGDDAAGGLWLEFALAIKGEKQLRWSNGLKARLGVVDKTDEQLALEEIEAADMLAELTLEQWRAVMGLDLRAELLNVASAGDAVLLWDWLAGYGIVELPSEPPDFELPPITDHVPADVDYANDPN